MITLQFKWCVCSLLPAPSSVCRLSLPFLLPSRSDRTKRSYFFPASRCRFYCPREAIEPRGVIFSPLLASCSLLPAPSSVCRFSLPFLLPSRSDRTKRSYFFPLLASCSLLPAPSSVCRFSLPFLLPVLDAASRRRLAKLIRSAVQYWSR